MTKNTKLFSTVEISLILGISEKTFKYLTKSLNIPSILVGHKQHFNLNIIKKHFRKIEEASL